mgnify:CR=1 FL=1
MTTSIMELDTKEQHMLSDKMTYELQLKLGQLHGSMKDIHV